MNGSGPTDAQRRLLAVVAQRLPAERVRELHLFAPIRQGGVETGLAVIAVGEPESEAVEPTFEPAADGSRFIGVTHFPSVEAMQRLLEMGMLEGMQSALGQLDGVLAEGRGPAAGVGASPRGA